MRVLRYALFLFVYILCIYYPCTSPQLSSPPTYANGTGRNPDRFFSKLSLSFFDAFNISIIGLLIILTLFNLLLHLSTHVRFIEFSVNLSLMQKRIARHRATSPLVMIILYTLLVSEYEEYWYFLICNINMNLLCKIKFLYTKNLKFLRKTFSLLIVFYIFYQANTPFGELLCLLITQNSCYLLTNRNCNWLPLVLIKLSNDVHPNPGQFQNSYFTFMNWNCNSIAKDDFHRIKLLEAQNSVFNYDLISLCETSLNDDVQMPDPGSYLNNEYTFISSNKPDNTRHGGVGLLYKNSLPLKVRNDLSFSETIVVELKFGRKNFFLPSCTGARHLTTQQLNLQTL